MGTTYDIATIGGKNIELDEMSNTLTLWVGAEKTDRAEPEVIVKIALKMLTVCSYWMEDGAIEKAIQEYKDAGYSW